MGNQNNWVVVKLEGVTANKMALGARVDVEIEENGQTRHVYEMVTSGASFGGNSLQLEIGLGKAKEIKTLNVFWPDKQLSKQTFQHLTINKAYQIKQGDEPKAIDYSPVPFSKEAHHHH